jgi:hypothetical protein
LCLWLVGINWLATDPTMQFGTTEFGGRDDGDIGTAYRIAGLNAYFSYMRMYSRYRRCPGRISSRVPAQAARIDGTHGQPAA